MNNFDKEFINVFNTYYPFERYIVKNPKSINYLFDDAILTEIFIPSTEIKPMLCSDGSFLSYTGFDEDSIYIKLLCKGVEFRLAYFDFEENVRETIRDIIHEDIGGYEWECLYVEYDEEDAYKEMTDMLKAQKKLIINKYGKCNIKSNFKITNTIEIINKI